MVIVIIVSIVQISVWCNVELLLLVEMKVVNREIFISISIGMNYSELISCIRLCRLWCLRWCFSGWLWIRWVIGWWKCIMNSVVNSVVLVLVRVFRQIEVCLLRLVISCGLWVILFSVVRLLISYNGWNVWCCRIFRVCWWCGLLSSEREIMYSVENSVLQINIQVMIIVRVLFREFGSIIDRYRVMRKVISQGFSLCRENSSRLWVFGCCGNFVDRLKCLCMCWLSQSSVLVRQVQRRIIIEKLKIIVGRLCQLGKCFLSLVCVSWNWLFYNVIGLFVFWNCFFRLVRVLLISFSILFLFFLFFLVMLCSCFSFFSRLVCCLLFFRVWMIWFSDCFNCVLLIFLLLEEFFVNGFGSVVVFGGEQNRVVQRYSSRVVRMWE